MSPETEALLNVVRDAEDPSATDERRVLSAVRMTIAAGVVSSTAASVSSSMAALAKTNATVATKVGLLHGAGGVVASKVGVVVVCALSSIGVSAAVVTSLEEEVATPLTASATRAFVLPAWPETVGVDPMASPIESSEDPITPPSVVGEAPSRAKPVGSDQPVLQSPPEAPPSLESELLLLKQVQTALRRGDGREALRLLDAHPTSERRLAAERGVARILALCAIGRNDEARRAADGFIAEHPESMHREVVANSCAMAKRASER